MQYNTFVYDSQLFLFKQPKYLTISLGEESLHVAVDEQVEQLISMTRAFKRDSITIVSLHTNQTHLLLKQQLRNTELVCTRS
jgi:hypothetical protein